MTNKKRLTSNFRGVNAARISVKQNVRERVFAEEWQRFNKGPDKYLTQLAWMLSRDQRFIMPPSPRDYEVAATVIQWLGTEGGQSWLQKTMKRADNAASVASEEWDEVPHHRCEECPSARKTLELTYQCSMCMIIMCKKCVPKHKKKTCLAL